jgi:hypothetical protein
MELHLAGVQASADLDSYLACGLLEAQCAADTTRRAVECCEKTIARNIHLPPTERCKLTSYDGMMAIETCFPCFVADAGHALRGAHNVGKQHRCEHTVDVTRRPYAGQKLLNFVDDGILVARPWHVVVALQLHEASARNLRR